MERELILSKVMAISKDVFGDEDIELTEASSAADVEAWNSLAHLSIISDIEDEFRIKFTMNEITQSKNLGELIDIVMRKIEEKA